MLAGIAFAMFIVNPEYKPRNPSFLTILFVTQKIFSLTQPAYGFSYYIRVLTTSWGYETEQAINLAIVVLAIKYFALN